MAQDLRKKRHLVFYSGGLGAGNYRLHEAMASLNSKKPRSFTYVPYSHENGEYFFKRIKNRYRRFGFRKFRYCPVDAIHTKKELRQALKSDVVYLAGGNTFYFLKHLRQSGFLDQLHKFVRRGGILAGLSAGAIIMTKTIFLAGYPKHEADLNEVRLKNLNGLNLVDFEFYPHFSGSAKTSRALEKYTRQNDRPVFACPDGSGVIVCGDEIRLMGPIYLFHKGRKIKIA